MASPLYRTPLDLGISGEQRGRAGVFVPIWYGANNDRSGKPNSFEFIPNADEDGVVGTAVSDSVDAEVDSKSRGAEEGSSRNRNLAYTLLRFLSIGTALSGGTAFAEELGVDEAQSFDVDNISLDSPHMDHLISLYEDKYPEDRDIQDNELRSFARVVMSVAGFDPDSPLPMAVFENALSQYEEVQQENHRLLEDAVIRQLPWEQRQAAENNPSARADIIQTEEFKEIMEEYKRIISNWVEEIVENNYVHFGEIFEISGRIIEGKDTPDDNRKFVNFFEYYGLKSASGRNLENKWAPDDLPEKGNDPENIRGFIGDKFQQMLMYTPDGMPAFQSLWPDGTPPEEMKEITIDIVDYAPDFISEGSMKDMLGQENVQFPEQPIFTSETEPTLQCRTEILGEDKVDPVSSVPGMMELIEEFAEGFERDFGIKININVGNPDYSKDSEDVPHIAVVGVNGNTDATKGKVLYGSAVFPRGMSEWPGFESMTSDEPYFLVNLNMVRKDGLDEARNTLWHELGHIFGLGHPFGHPTKVDLAPRVSEQFAYMSYGHLNFCDERGNPSYAPAERQFRRWLPNAPKLGEGSDVYNTSSMNHDVTSANFGSYSFERYNILPASAIWDDGKKGYDSLYGSVGNDLIDLQEGHCGQVKVTQQELEDGGVTQEGLAEAAKDIVRSIIRSQNLAEELENSIENKIRSRIEGGAHRFLCILEGNMEYYNGVGGSDTIITAAGGDHKIILPSDGESHVNVYDSDVGKVRVVSFGDDTLGLSQSIFEESEVKVRIKGKHLVLEFDHPEHGEGKIFLVNQRAKDKHAGKRLEHIRIIGDDGEIARDADGEELSFDVSDITSARQFTKRVVDPIEAALERTPETGVDQTIESSRTQSQQQQSVGRG